MKCDNCRKKDYPLLFTFEFFGQAWNICPRCAAHLLYVLKNFPAYIVPPRAKKNPKIESLPKNSPLRDRLEKQQAIAG